MSRVRPAPLSFSSSLLIPFLSILLPSSRTITSRTPTPTPTFTDNHVPPLLPSFLDNHVPRTITSRVRPALTSGVLFRGFMPACADLYVRARTRPRVSHRAYLSGASCPRARTCTSAPAPAPAPECHIGRAFPGLHAGMQGLSRPRPHPPPSVTSCAPFRGFMPACADNHVRARTRRRVSRLACSSGASCPLSRLSSSIHARSPRQSHLHEILDAPVQQATSRAPLRGCLTEFNHLHQHILLFIVASLRVGCPSPALCRTRYRFGSDAPLGLSGFVAVLGDRTFMLSLASRRPRQRVFPGIAPGFACPVRDDRLPAFSPGDPRPEAAPDTNQWHPRLDPDHHPAPSFHPDFAPHPPPHALLGCPASSQSWATGLSCSVSRRVGLGSGSFPGSRLALPARFAMTDSRLSRPGTRGQRPRQTQTNGFVSSFPSLIPSSLLSSPPDISSHSETHSVLFVSIRSASRSLAPARRARLARLRPGSCRPRTHSIITRKT
ncbi:hypothetical protein B0H16DRAFT_1738646 [Mycena metata]|uniref:Uncharacterized protein n=1 Tax=Mycena metata TaxID=1033252 RepID=A0AAD7MJS6_9AGAR|nr:hypothetical protein B0H16DRAFT_1738646 [Mycena metata]